MTAIGDRVRLVRCNDPYTRLKPGDEGTVSFIDDMNTVFVNWDSGSNLGLVRRAGDAWEVLFQETEMEAFDASSIEADPMSAQRHGL